MKDVRSACELAAALDEFWSPRVIAELDDNYVKVAKVHGTFGWHAHADEDELFVLLGGCLNIEMEDRSVVLQPGELFVMPKGVRHNPSSEEVTLVMLIERKSTLHSGEEVCQWTRSVNDQVRAV